MSMMSIPGDDRPAPGNVFHAAQKLADTLHLSRMPIAGNQAWPSPRPRCKFDDTPPAWAR